MALSKGCTIGLIIVAVLIVIIVVGIIVIGPKLVEKGVGLLIDTTEKEIIANLPDGYTPEMVHQIMTDLKTAINNKELGGTEIQELVNTFQAATADKEIDKEEGRNLLVMIQEALGQEPPVMPEETPPDSAQVVPDSA